MALVRPSEKQIAANRANARKSTGPRSPEGKVRTSQNAGKHHLYPRTHTILPQRQERIIHKVIEATAELATDQHRRDLHARYIYFELWCVELDALADSYFQQTLARCGNDFRRAAHPPCRSRNPPLRMQPSPSRPPPRPPNPTPQDHGCRSQRGAQPCPSGPQC